MDSLSTEIRGTAFKLQKDPKETVEGQTAQF